MFASNMKAQSIRFGEVTAGSVADRIPLIRADREQHMLAARAAAAAGELSPAARRAFERAGARRDRQVHRGIDSAPSGCDIRKRRFA